MHRQNGLKRQYKKFGLLERCFFTFLNYYYCNQMDNYMNKYTFFIA